METNPSKSTYLIVNILRGNRAATGVLTSSISKIYIYIPNILQLKNQTATKKESSGKAARAAQLLRFHYPLSTGPWGCSWVSSGGYTCNVNFLIGFVASAKIRYFSSSCFKRQSTTCKTKNRKEALSAVNLKRVTPGPCFLPIIQCFGSN